MTISRRELLRRASVLGVSVAWPLGACRSDADADDDDDDGTNGSTGEDTSSDTSSSSTGGDDLPQYEYDGEPGPADLFQHGVASGDPLVDAVILWSRVSGPTDAVLEAFYEVALDPDFTMRRAAAYVTTGAQRDYTIKIDASGLEPGTTYYYRFFALGRTSPIGRTRTAGTGALDRMRIAVMSCSSLAHGWFHAYRRVAERADLDLVVHLGDYIYEYGNAEYGELREYEPAHEILSLADYRTRYSQYRRDPDLQECHRQHPMVAVWDDHEIANNAWAMGAANHSTSTEGPFADRYAAAYQCYVEWMPLREGAEAIVYRSLAFGDLLHLVMLDTRIVGREQQLDSVMDPLFDDPDRQLLGATQEAWLEGELGSTAQWKLLGQQVMVAQLRLGENPLNLDQWDGYPAARERLLDMIREHAPTNVVILTGDIHSSWAFEISEDPYGPDYDPVSGSGAVAIEIITPSVTSPGFPLDSATQFMQTHPHLKWGNLVDHGYVILDVTPERLQASWWLVADVTLPDDGTESVAAAWSIADGSVHLTTDAAPAPPRDNPPPLAP